MNKDLIERILARPPAKSIHGGRRLCLPHPATEEELAAIEAELGFALPPLLRELYATVANGGFGPDFGFLPLTKREGGEGMSMIEVYRECSLYPRAQWPRRLLPLVCTGGVTYDCCDCADPQNRVVNYDCDTGDIGEWIAQNEGWEVHEAARQQAPYPDYAEWTAFRATSPSLEMFLESWLAASDAEFWHRWYGSGPFLPEVAADDGDFDDSDPFADD